ncbi:Stromal interaction molecule-like protein [Aphelenchoides fujianensis]|nr:Stromal interaction molecule-like protein [Aphelenchoides fujianensis]
MRGLISSCLLLLINSQHILLLDAQTVKPTKHVAITAEDEKWRDPEGYAAIRELHSQMDDDKSGSIDRAESADVRPAFLKVDLKVAGSDRAVRENAFHHKTDESVTVDDLWESWFQSTEREWTTYDMVNWLTNVVRLPQYAENLLNAKSTGIVLPRMAVQNSSYIIEILKVKNSVHRQKIQLKALDVVLFGVHDSSTMKDLALAILAASFIALLRGKSTKQLEELSSQLAVLNTMENNFDAGSAEDLEHLKDQIREMEQQLDAQSNYDPANGMFNDLQPLLRLTYEKELAYVQMSKAECLNEMKVARDFVDKMRRKQGSLLNSLKLATGATTGTDSIDLKIFKLKERMESIKLEIAELHNRYVQIENILGFQIMTEGKREEIYRGVPSSPSSSYLSSLSNGHKNSKEQFFQEGMYYAPASLCSHYAPETADSTSSSSSDGAEL